MHPQNPFDKTHKRSARSNKGLVDFSFYLFHYGSSNSVLLLLCAFFVAIGCTLLASKYVCVLCIALDILFCRLPALTPPTSCFLQLLSRICSSSSLLRVIRQQNDKVTELQFHYFYSNAEPQVLLPTDV